MTDTAEQRAMRREGEAATGKMEAALRGAGHVPKPNPAPDAGDSELKDRIAKLEDRVRLLESRLFSLQVTGGTGPQVTLSEIAKHVARQYDLSVKDLKSARRDRTVVIARQQAFWLARKKTECSLPQIGRFFGGRDHGTVHHGIKKHQKRRELGQ